VSHFLSPKLRATLIALKKRRVKWLRIWIKVSHSYMTVGGAMALGILLTLDGSVSKDSLPSNSDGLSREDEINISKHAWDYFYPAWTELRPSVGPQPTTPLASNGSDYLISDPDNRVEVEFKIAPALRPLVQFWFDIYSKWNSQTRLVHDRLEIHQVYGYIDFQPLFRKYSAAKAEALSQRYEEKIMAQLPEKLRQIGSGNPSADMSQLERQSLHTFLSRMGALSKKAIEERIQNIRTQTGQRDIFLKAIQRSTELLPHIESVFKKNHLPASLSRIPFVESSFNPKAQSKLGAIGLWQFMPPTAKQMIHPENEADWSDPIKQTKAAAKLLMIYRSLLPDWSTTVTAYNSGVGRLQKLTRKYRAQCMNDILKVSNDDQLGFAGKNFYPEFLAANLVERYKDKIFGTQLLGSQIDLVLKDGQEFRNPKCGGI